MERETKIPVGQRRERSLMVPMKQGEYVFTKVLGTTMGAPSITLNEMMFLQDRWAGHDKAHDHRLGVGDHSPGLRIKRIARSHLGAAQVTTHIYQVPS